MPERTDGHSHTAIRWPLFIVLALALVAVSLLTGLWVQAGPPAEVRPTPQISPLAAGDLPARYTAVLTETQIFLPLVTACRLQGVTLTGPGEPGTIGFTYTFTVEVPGPNVTLPLTYAWQATGHEPVVHTAGLTDTLDLLWELTGSQVITVEVSNGGCTVPLTVAFDVTTRGLIVYESKPTPGSEQHDLMLVHNEHPGMIWNLTNTPDVDEGGPTWSPDGNWIAYSAGDLSNWNRAIYKIDLGTRQV